MKDSLFERFKKYAVQAESVEDFCIKYHSRRAFHERGEAYMAYDINAHKEELERYGYTMIPSHDSETGEAVTYYREK